MKEIKSVFLCALFLTSFVFSSFAQTQSPTVKKKHRKKKVVELLPTQPQLSIALFTISGNVQKTSQYCGGAAPSEEMMRQYERPVVYAGKRFYVREGDSNQLNKSIVDSFISDTNGMFALKLKPGTYSIIQVEQLKKINYRLFTSQSQVVDSSCLKKWWAAPYYLLNVKDRDIKGLNFVFSHQCFVTSDIPCIYYTGPMPP